LKKNLKLAFIITHPIQYYAPLYRQLSKRQDIAVRIFFTWHNGTNDAMDYGFKKNISWDIPLADGYEHELVPNCSSHPGSHHFMGINNPSLIKSVMKWNPDAIHITGYAFLSNILALRAFHKLKIPILFRGDSHLLDKEGVWKKVLKKKVLKYIFNLPSAFLYVGKNNYNYFKYYGVHDEKLFYCPHSIDVERFSTVSNLQEKQAAKLRNEIGIKNNYKVLLFAGKFEKKKQPIQLMRAFSEISPANTIMLMVGNGELEHEVKRMVAKFPELFRLLPFQNQSMMPVIYRLGDLFILPSAFRETWGLAVNEAMACSRPVLASDRVGCATDLIIPGKTGEIFKAYNWGSFKNKLISLLHNPNHLKEMGKNARDHISNYTFEKTVSTLLAALKILHNKGIH